MKELWFFVRLFKPYKIWLVSGLLLAILTTISAIALLTLSGWFITSSAVAGFLATDGIAFTFNFLQPAAQIRALAIIRTTGRYAERVLTHEATFRVLAEIRSWFFARLTPLSPVKLASYRGADLLNGITRNIDFLDALYLRICLPVLVAVFSAFVVVVFLSSYSVEIAILILIVLVIVAVLPLIFYQRVQQYNQLIVKQAAEFKVQQVELLQGLAELKHFDAYHRYADRMIEMSDKMIDAQRWQQKLTALPAAITDFISNLAFLSTLLLAAVLFQQNILTGAQLVMLGFCALAIFEVFSPLSGVIALFGKTRVAAQNILDIALTKPMETETAESGKSIPDNADIVIRHLSFRYTDDSEWLLKNINISIPYGSKVAITGKSGVGKTTLIHLLLRFFQQQHGSIQFAGIEHKHFSSDQLMQHIAVLTQRSELFAASIRDNLLIAKPDAAEAELYQAIKLAGLSEFIAMLPDGLDTWVGEDGKKVSGGEARRIALARIYLKNSAIILLDEPTEGLDEETEVDILNCLSRMLKDKTLIMVSHRISVLNWADSVYKLSEEGLFETEL